MEKIQHLPSELQREILSYMIPDPNNIEFIDYIKNSYNIDSSYSLKYKTAFYKNTNSKIRNDKGLFLSRIPKKNGKYRYYITKEIKTLDDYDIEYDDHGAYNYYYTYEYTSIYVGKNINQALLTLFSG